MHNVSLHTHALAHVRRPRATLVILFLKIDFLLILKGYIFHFNTPQVNSIFDWALNWPWALKFEHHWGMGAQVVRSTKCGVYKPLLQERTHEYLHSIQHV